MLLYLIISLVVLSHVESQQSTFENINNNATIRKFIPKAKSFSHNINVDQLRTTSILYGLVVSATPHDVGVTCFNHMRMLYEGIHSKEIWAIKALDASGTADSGFVWGNNFWLGSRKSCEAIQTLPTLTLAKRYNRNMKENLVEELAPFNMEYRSIHGRHESSWQVEVKFLNERTLNIGLCLPKECSNNEISYLARKYFDGHTLLSQRMYEYNVTILDVKDLHLKDSFYEKKTVKWLGSILLFTTVMTIIGLFVEKKTIDQNDNKISEVREKSFFMKLIEFYSIRDNLNWVFDTTPTKQTIPVLNGLRGICCFMIIIFHMSWYSHFTVNNPAFMFEYGEKLHLLLASNAAMLVDVFFTISGFLLAYNFLRNAKKMEEIRRNNFKANFKSYMKTFVTRYLRLTPLYGLILLGGEVMTSYIVDKSQFFVFERNDLYCQNTWWQSILYIQNFFEIRQMCMNHTWSMACDLQYFLVFTLILYSYAKNPKLGKSVFLVVSGITFLRSIQLTFRNDFVPTFDVLYNTGYELYTSFGARATPYYVGVYIGWLLVTLGESFTVGKKTVKCLWTLALATILLCLNGTMDRSIGIVFSSLFITFGRVIFSLSFSWIVLAAITGNNTFVSNFLQWQPLTHLNKISYSVYLLNPPIITFLYSLRESPAHVDPIMGAVTTIGITIIVYFMSILTTILFEIPVSKISTELLRDKKSKIK